ncbi:MAG: macro domain-containing protein [Acidobacteriota bacterium]|jgi:O-acetyl-ADP-ribose deacetylase (regulator of RNase III)
MPEEKTINNCNLRLIQQDITDFDIESFVFYAQPNLELGSGFGSAITRRGGQSIKKELDEIGSAAITEAVITGGGSLKAKYIVHAVGPAFQEEQLEEKLYSTILSSLKKAEEKGIRHIAFPPMGTGFYGVPLAASMNIMTRAFEEYLSNGGQMEEIVICANDPREYRAFQVAFTK